MIREGAHASYIGPESDGLVDGDRCFVLADEGSYSQVRWVTGSCQDRYTTVSNRHLVSDRKTKVSAFDDDEFGFEADRPRAVRVACGVVHASGGDSALMRALEHDGVLDGPRILARRAVASIRQALLSDPVWAEVVSELGESGVPFLSSVMHSAMMSALDEGVDNEALEEG